MAVDQAVFDAPVTALGDFHLWFTKKEIEHLPNVLTVGEKIRALTSGKYEGSFWLIAVTDQRVLFLDRGRFFGLKQAELPLRRISAISHKTGLMFGELHLATSSGKSVVKQIPKSEVSRIASVLSSLVRGSHAPLQAASDMASYLERLASLRDRGLLTPEEFATQKARLLA